MNPDHVTTVFDLAGFLLLAVAVGMALWLLWPPAGPAGGAAVLLAASWFIDHRGRKADAEDDQR